MLARNSRGLSRSAQMLRTHARGIAVGDKFPNVEVDAASWPPTALNLNDRIKDKKVPGYKDHRNDVRDAGIDEVLVYCVNDAAVMEAWAKNQRIAGTNITFLADPSMVLTEALDMGVVKHVAESGTPEDAAADAPGANANSAVKGMLEAIAKL
ncbi:peroxiredoxin-like protein [Emiliania huxleyi CCMP1516]|uniref:Redoxin domain-containing protein n=2 Tax=Emiliania huxleyi TaxID=2903 RepID=A0A0D3KM59_EMIH1|nr:peroxiredoxin-like protein [Emiliania huxleyi CCMP1516]EOD36844.1 peroxiredoxin-like protein [Emiliania huxleyi CCMP1516]|eukprot:XP_005789273.1 peroxiredoxin-like protein [Emiliania huxleyi CCMP1516]